MTASVYMVSLPENPLMLDNRVIFLRGHWAIVISAIKKVVNFDG